MESNLHHIPYNKGDNCYVICSYKEKEEQEKYVAEIEEFRNNYNYRYSHGICSKCLEKELDNLNNHEKKV